ncbi:LysR substrate-binding domain-containing protein [Shewanella corallii]|uniref:LysR substrate-binding domain-containing protein n=1 Tax=Shewanella corallii TaxID=560080 RepID=A0ABT0N800_9GAMM|nr:LysR family transcriptional regulator [Shewanella corallii]MCL2914591.1 LysR substrate-binding domain-containing protein [Shewanella corallii]
MELTRLKSMAVFAAVVQQGSFNKAARLLGISRPAVSEQLKKLEQQLSVRLLHRNTRGFSLTQEGEKVLPLAALVLESIGSLDQVLIENEPRGTIRLTATFDFARNWLLPRLKAFNELYPMVQFDLVISDERLDLIGAGIDIALRAANIQEEGFVARPIFDDVLQLYAAPAYLNSLKREIGMGNLHELRWVLLEQLMPGNEVTLKSDQGRRRFVPDFFHRVNSPEILFQLILNGHGIGCLIEHIARDHLEKGDLVRVLPDWYGRNLSLYLLYPSRLNLPKRVRLLIDFLMET